MLCVYNSTCLYTWLSTTVHAHFKTDCFSRLFLLKYSKLIIGRFESSGTFDANKSFGLSFQVPKLSSSDQASKFFKCTYTCTYIAVFCVCVCMHMFVYITCAVAFYMCVCSAAGAASVNVAVYLCVSLSHKHFFRSSPAAEL